MANNTHTTAANQFIEAGNINFAYRRFGKQSGIPVILFAHFRASMENWDPSVTDGLAAEREVILFSNTGIGLTSGETPETVKEMAQDAILFIEALGLKQVDLLGFSLGGFIAQQITIDRPDLVRRLVLAGTGPEGGQNMQEYPPEITALAINEVPVMEDFQVLFFSPSKAGQNAGKAFWERRHLRTAQTEPPSTPQVMAAQAKAIGLWGIPAKSYPQLNEIKQPVLITNGSNDVMVPTINSYITYVNIPNSKLILYPDSGHGFLFQYPEEFVADVNAFLFNA